MPRRHVFALALRAAVIATAIMLRHMLTLLRLPMPPLVIVAMRAGCCLMLLEAR